MLSKLMQRRKRSFFWKSLILVLLITCIPVALLGISLYYVGTDRIAAALSDSHQEQMKQSAHRVHDYLSHLELFSAQLAFNPGFDESLGRLDFAQQFERTDSLLKSLSLMKESNPLIHNVFLYLKDSDKLISYDSGVRTIQSDEDRRLFRGLLSEPHQIAFKPYIKQIHIKDRLFHAVVIQLSGSESEYPYGAFLLYLDPAVLNGLVENLTPSGSTSFLLDERGNYITEQPIGRLSPSAELTASVRHLVLQEERMENTFIYNWKNEKYSVSYEKIRWLDSEWTYVSATPLSRITAPVTAMSKWIVAVSCFGLLTALVLSWFASKRIYHPIRRLKESFAGKTHIAGDDTDEIAYIEREWTRQLKESEAMQQRIKESLPSIRQGFLIQFLQGQHLAYTEEMVAAKLKQLDWDIGGMRFGCLTVQLHGLSHAKKFAENDRELISFAALNMLHDLIYPRFPMYHLITFSDFTAGVFLILEPKPDQELKHELKDFAEQAITVLRNVLGMNVTVVAGRITDRILEAPDILEQTRQALSYRKANKESQLLDLDDFIAKGGEPAPFPFELEKEIVNALSIGLESETNRLIREFLRELRRVSATEQTVHQGMTKLLASMLDAIMKAGGDLNSLYPGVHMYEQLLNIRDADDMPEWFEHKVVAPFISSYSASADPELLQAVEQIVRRMDEELMSDISLSNYAIEYELSPYKLSRGFKQITGLNFVDYLTRLRLEKCKKLLLTTDLKVNDIADLLRYHPSYLIRIFKRSEGLTPGQYRDKHN